MRSLADLDDYSVEIRVPLSGREWRKGSGYLVGPCRILTALHVLVGRDAVLSGEPVSLPGLIEVRAHGDFADRFGEPDVVLERYVDTVRSRARDGDFLWRPATVCWPQKGIPVPRYDLAILEVRPEVALRHIMSAPRILCIKPSMDILCRGTGFPEWVAETTNGVDVSSPRPVTGTLSFGDATPRGFHSFTATNGAPRNSDEWQRISGTAFFGDGADMLVGVASAVEPTAGNTGLWLTQLSDLAKSDEFREFWTAAGMRPPSERFMRVGSETIRLLIDPLAYLYEFDRIVPSDRVLDVFDPPSAAASAAVAVQQSTTSERDDIRAPPIYLIAGRRIDLPEEMVKRIQIEIAPDFIGTRDGDPTTLMWRYAAEGYLPGQVVAKLREEISRSLKVERPRTIVSLDSLRESAKGRDWNLIINVDKAKEQDATTLCDFLGEFAKFGHSQRPPSLFVNIVPGESTLTPKSIPRIAWFISLVKNGSAALAEHIMIIDDIFLDDCDFEHIGYWTESLDKFCRITAQQCRVLLERTFRVGGYALSDVKECLSAAASVR
jgi:hypothetical protein